MCNRTDATILLMGCLIWGLGEPTWAQQTRPPWTTSKISGTPQPPDPYAIEPAFAKLSFRRPTSLTELPGNRMLVTEIGGTIVSFEMHDHVDRKDELLKFAPGDPYRSVLLYRMNKLGYGRMPYIGSQKVDSQGVALIEQWIRSLPHNSSDEDSQLVRDGTAEANAIESLKQRPRPVYLPTDKSCAELIKSTEGAMALTLALHSGAVRGTDADQIYGSAPGDIRGLFETFVPESLRRKTLGRDAKPDSILALQGNALRGELIFFSDGARCRNCHDERDAAKSTGPTLADIRQKYKDRRELLDQILDPSKKIDEKYASWIIVTDAGNIHSGLLISEDEQQLVLKTPEQKTVRVPRADVIELKKGSKSLMPDGILSDLTAQEAADLLQWLQQAR